VIVLGIDTATPQVGVALAGPDGPLASLQVAGGRRHGEILAPAIDALCRLASVGLDSVDAVAVDIGPGLFTGLRVGIATAQALAVTLDVPTVGRSSLDVLAHPHLRGGRAVAAVVDARRGEVFWALYRPGPAAMEAITAAAVCPPEAAVAALAPLGGAGVLVVGDGGHRYAGVFGSVRGIEVAGPAHTHPSPEALVEMACADLAAARAGGPPERLVPLYLRSADVRIGWDQRSAPAERRG